MFERLIAFVLGKVQISVSGLSAERFLNLCAGASLELYDLKMDDQCYLCTLSLSDYKIARRLSRKSHVLIHIIKKSGLPFLLHRYRKRKAWGVGLVSSIIILYVMSFFLWDIQFEGNHYYTDDVLMSFLQEQNIVHGMKRNSIQCDELEQKIRNRFHNITWLSAQISGTRLIINIKENFGIMSIKERDKKPSDIIASADGVITKIITRKGIPIVKAGDPVKKGQLLVSGKIPIINDSRETIAYETVSADATIYAEIELNYSKQFPVLKEEKENISSRNNGMCFFYGSNYFMVGSNRIPREMQYSITEYYPVKLFSNYILPIYGTKTETYTYQTKVDKWTTAEQQYQADKEFAFYLDKILSWKGNLISETRTIEQQDFSFIDHGKLVLEIPFGVDRDINDENE